MTSYQKLKKENEDLKNKLNQAEEYYEKCYETLWQIAALIGPDCLEGPKMAWKILMELRQK